MSSRTPPTRIMPAVKSETCFPRFLHERRKQMAVGRGRPAAAIDRSECRLLRKENSKVRRTGQMLGFCGRAIHSVALLRRGRQSVQLDIDAKGMDNSWAG